MSYTIKVRLPGICHIRKLTKVKSALTLVMPIVGKARQLAVHAKSCALLQPTNLGTDLQETVLARMAESENKENHDPQARMGTSNKSVTPKHVTHCPLKHLRTAESSYDQLPSWSPKIQKEFDGDFVQCIVANGWAFHCSVNPQTKIFLEKWSHGPPTLGQAEMPMRWIAMLVASQQDTTSTKAESTTYLRIDHVITPYPPPSHVPPSNKAASSPHVAPLNPR
jgi:hypothetical protein